MTRTRRVLIAMSALALTIMTCPTAAFMASAQQRQAVTSHVLADPGGSTCCTHGN